MWKQDKYMLAEHILEIEILETRDFLETKFIYK